MKSFQGSEIKKTHYIDYINICTQIIIGEKKSSSGDSTSSKKARTDKDPAVGCYVTLKCQKYKEWIPQIGQVERIDESQVTIDWLDGTYTGTWTFWKYRGKAVREVFPRRAVINQVKFTPAMRLSKSDVESIKKDYLDAEYVQCYNN